MIQKIANLSKLTHQIGEQLEKVLVLGDVVERLVLKNSVNQI